MEPIGTEMIRLLAARPADALLYVDPGSGALILQFLAAVAVGAMYYLRQALATVTDWLPGAGDA